MQQSCFIPVDNYKLERKDNCLIYKPNSFKSKDNNLLKIAKQKSLKRDALQQSFLIYLLSQLGYNIIISKLYKKSKRNPLFRLKAIYDNRSLLNKMDENINNIVFSDNIFNDNQFNDLKSKRRNIDSVTNSILLNLLTLNNSTYVCKKSKQTQLINLNKPYEMKRIIQFQLNDIIFNKSDILKLGEKINSFIYRKVIKHDFNFNRNTFYIFDNFL